MLLVLRLLEQCTCLALQLLFDLLVGCCVIV